MAIYLVTGGAGFVGCHLCAELIDAGHEVRVLDSMVEQAHRSGNGMPRDATILRGDVRDLALVGEALCGVDGVFHLAAEVGVGQSMYEIERYVSANDCGTAVLLQQMIDKPVKRVVVASSMSVYGEGLYASEDGSRMHNVRRTDFNRRSHSWDPSANGRERLTPIGTDESKRPDLASVYALSKYVQEQLTLIVAPAYGIEAVALRLFNVFGPGQCLSNPYTGVLAIFAGRLLHGEAPVVFEDGLQRRDFVHVKDVAHAFRLAMETPGIDGQVFNIGSGRSYAIVDVASMLAQAMMRNDVEPKILQQSRFGDIRHCFADISKAQALLGFEPSITLEEGLGELVDWIRAQEAGDYTPQAHKELEERGLVV